MTPNPDESVVSFTEMQLGTAADYELLDRHEQAYAAGLADRLLDTLERLTGSLGGYQVSRLEHSLQTATRARAGSPADTLPGSKTTAIRRNENVDRNEGRIVLQPIEANSNGGTGFQPVMHRQDACATHF